MAAIFTRTSVLAVKLVAVTAFVVFVASLAWAYVWPRTDYLSFQTVPLPQPVPFSHEHHVAGLGIDCRYCHNSVEVSANAGLPPTHTCMSCHSQIWTNAPVLSPVRRSLGEDEPIAWNRVATLPDYVYFKHDIHIAKGVGCAECHGRVDRMPLMWKANNFTMSFCLDCHRDPGPRLRPRAAVFDTEWRRDATTPSPEALMVQYGIGGRDLTGCYICHR